MRAVAFVPEIGPGFSLDTLAYNKAGLSLRDMVSYRQPNVAMRKPPPRLRMHTVWMSLVMPAVYQFKLSSPVACATIVIFVAFLFWAMHWKTQRRRRTMQEFADTRNLEQIVGHIPKDFPNEMLNEIFSGFFGPYWSFAGNMVGGNREDGYVLAFDIYVRDGRVVIPSTVVARRSLTSYRPRPCT